MIESNSFIECDHFRHPFWINSGPRKTLVSATDFFLQKFFEMLCNYDISIYQILA